MDGGRIEGDECPICGMQVLSDAAVREYRALCGMAIPEPSAAHVMRLDEGRELYFCCGTCKRTYSREVVPHTAVRLLERTAHVICPHCARTFEAEMPISICLLRITCPMCGREIEPREGDCCVFCSWADNGCPMSQAIERSGWFPSSPIAGGP
jgi:YHS domain-containing protein